MLFELEADGSNAINTPGFTDTYQTSPKSGADMYDDLPADFTISHNRKLPQIKLGEFSIG